MGKRGNEHQLTKDDFEADVEKSSVESPGTSFAKATPDELAKRRIIRSAKRPVSSSVLPSVSSDFGGASSSGNGAFANINLVSTGSVTFSASTKPKFALPSLPQYSQPSSSTSNANKNPFGGVSLTDTSSFSEKSTTPNSECKLLTEKFREYIKSADLRKDYELPAIRYLTTMNNLLQKREEETKSQTRKQNSTAGNTSNTTVSSSETSQSLFPPAPAPVSFSFGSASPKSAPAPATNSTFSFGSSSSNNAGPPSISSAGTSGFNFAPAPVAAIPTPGANMKISLSPVPPLAVTKPTTSSNDDGEEEDGTLPPEEKTELASADDDWDSLLTVKVRAYNYRSENKPRKFAGGALKVQQHKESKKRRMVLRDGAGKVWINIGIFSGMKFNKNKPASKPGTRPAGNITFVGVNDQERGGEMFSLVCSVDDLDGFHKILEESSS